MLCKLVPRNKPTQAPPKRRCLSRCTMVSRRANPHQGLPSFSCLRLPGSSDFGACLVSELLIAKRKTLALKVAPPELAPGIHEGGFRTFPRFRKASCQARGKWCHASTSKPSPKRNIWSNEPVRRLLKGKTWNLCNPTLGTRDMGCPPSLLFCAVWTTCAPRNGIQAVMLLC